MLLEKSSRERLFFSVTVSEQAVNLHYGQSSSQTPLTASFRTEGRLTPERWTHLVLQTHCYGCKLFEQNERYTDHLHLYSSQLHLTTNVIGDNSVQPGQVRMEP
ncbi:hypothetical protein F7725_026128 [Dissostichus mawsoni]|uniref:Uncharacterized protein n=1 Tax=Dissostichus mawsoni TaxID=36200 RepID=A0A7J5X6J7_DISMA|nr:hypothetical protein F7725_026128 [Dissostichus mawsoni]